MQPEQQPQQNQEQNQKPDNLMSDWQTQQKRKKKMWTIIIIIVLVLLAAGAFGYWQYMDKNQNKNYNSSTSSGPSENNNNSYNPPTSTGDNNAIPTTTPSSYNPDAYESQQCKNRLAPVVSKSGIVEWVEPKKLPSLHLFPAVNDPNQGGYLDVNYIVGHLKTGKYAGGDLIVSEVTPDGPSLGERYRIISKDGKYYYLSKYSNVLPNPQWGVKLGVSFILDNDFDLPDLNFPEKLHLDSPKANFSYAKSLGFFQNGVDFFCVDHLVKVFSDSSVGDVYTDASAMPSGDPAMPNYYVPKNGFYVKGGDASLRTYQLAVPIMDEKNIPLVTWEDGNKNIEEYSYQAIGGCGASNFRDVTDVKETDLTQIGTTFDGKPVYGYKDSNTEELKTIYNEIYIPDEQARFSYSIFVANHPIFFWKDSLGKFIRFKDKKYQPLAECGKPVIYLYPTQTEKVSVKLDPQGGFTYSEPAYNSGWFVLADPNSNITNLADGKVYPYLFWEGRGGMYQTPSKGFVVKQTDVHEFLKTKLHELGLNTKEAADFMEFWEPKMQSAPYYFVTFMGNSVMDKLAPLTISPKPDTVIRILMDFTPLDKPINAQGYNIHTPERKGFTVVEWGGVLR